MAIRLNQIWRRFIDSLTVGWVGLLLLLFALPGMILDSLPEKLTFTLNPISQTLSGMYINFSWEFAAVGFTVLTIDRLYKAQEASQEKARLVQQLTSQDPRIVFETLAQLRAEGWLESGVLQGANLHHAHLARANLHGAAMPEANFHLANLSQADLEAAVLSGATLDDVNLEEANLQYANMQGATLHDSDLRGADLRGAIGVDDRILAAAKHLLDATLSNGKKYDGRYNLAGDLALARSSSYHLEDPTAMARFYDVSLAVYQAGQKRRKDNGAT